MRGDGEDDELSENGFTKELAESYVDSIIQSIKFGERDGQISKILTEKGIQALPNEESCDIHAPSGQDQEPPPTLVIKGTNPTSATATGTERTIWTPRCES